jgi:four helix bundle protein
LRVFLAQARGSLCEFETQIQLCEDLGFIQATQAHELFELGNEVGRMINGLLKTLDRKDAKPVS